MKTMVLVAALALALGGAAQAQSAAAPQAPAAVTPPHARHQVAAVRRTPQNGVPRYEMRRNGLMRNGLLPADGEQG